MSLTVLIIARLLTPSSSGHGTHTQLGLPPCTFRILTGHNCPGCGLTTSFSNLAHGQLGGALAANPLGVLLFSLVAISLPYFLFRTIRPISIDDFLSSKQMTIGIVAVALAMVGLWIVRLFLGQV